MWLMWQNHSRNMSNGPPSIHISIVICYSPLLCHGTVVQQVFEGNSLKLSVISYGIHGDNCYSKTSAYIHFTSRVYCKHLKLLDVLLYSTPVCLRASYTSVPSIVHLLLSIMLILQLLPKDRNSFF